MIGYDATELDMLKSRCTRILVRLGMLANGANVSLEEGGKSKYAAKHAESAPPRGIRLNGSASHELSLFEFWNAQFTRAWQDVEGGDEKAPERIETLLGRAHAAYRMFVSPSLLRLRNADTVTRDKRILERYQGMHYEWVAAVEDCSGMAIRRLREKDGQDPTYGLYEDAPIKCEACGFEDLEHADKAGRTCPGCGSLMSRAEEIAV